MTVQDNGTDMLSDTSTITVNINDVNEAPVLTPGAPSLTSITEEDTDNDGDPVSALTDGRIYDVDDGAVEGIALIAAGAGAGSWEYSLDSGSSWTAVGTVASDVALLLRRVDRVRYVPSGDDADSASISYFAWDRSGDTAGQQGTKIDIDALYGSRGGGTPFSTASDTASLTVTNINDTPVLAGSNDMPGITEDETDNDGDRISVILGVNVTDADSFDPEGIAITAVTGSDTWEYSTDGGTSWNSVESVAEDNALLVGAGLNDRIRYVPDGENGTTASFSFRAWDQSSGVAGNRVDPSGGGDDSAFSTASATSSTVVSDVNDNPSLTGLVGAVSYQEDTVKDAAQVIDGDILFEDVDDGDLNGGSMTVDYSIGGGAEDQLLIAESGGITLNGTEVLYGGNIIGDITVDGTDGTDLAVGFDTAETSAAAVGALVEALRYQNNSDAPTAERTIRIQCTDGDGGSFTESPTVAITVNAENDVPTATNRTQTKTYDEGTASVALDDIVVADPDADETITVTLTLALPSAGVLTADSGSGESYDQQTGVWEISSTVTAVNAALAAAAFEPTDNNDIDTSIATHVEDASGTGPADGTITLDVTPAADTPTATNMTQVKGYDEGTVSIALDDIVVTDSDTGDVITATLTLADPETGALTALSGNGESYNQGTGVWAVVGPVTLVNAALAAVAFEPGEQNDIDTTIATRVRDAAGTGPADGTMTLDVTPVNDAPAATNLPQSKTYNEGDTPINLDTIAVTDVDTGDTLTATLTLAAPSIGVLTASSGNGESYDAGTGVWNVAGSVTAVNTALAAIAFQPLSDNDHDTSIAVHLEDAAATGPAEGTITLDVVPLNDAPTATNLEQTQAYTEGDVSVALDDIVITDPDTIDTFTATLTLSDPTLGTLTASSGNGETYNGATGVWTVTGSMVTVNAALAASAFAPAENTDVNTTVTTSVEDAAGAGPAAGTVSLNVTPVNDPPEVSNLDQDLIYNEGDTVVPLDNIAVADVDTGETITAVLILADPALGTLTDSSGNGEAYDGGTGTWEITGTVAAVNAALAAVSFEPVADNDLDTTLTTHVEDAAGTGPADGVITLDVTAENDAPTATNLEQTQAYTEGDVSVALDDIVVDDPDEGDTLTAVLTLNPSSAGGLTASSGNGETYDGGTGIWEITGTVAALNGALAAVAFEPAEHNDVAAVITSHVQDVAGTGPEDGAIALDVTPVNDVPTADGMTHALSYIEDDATVELNDITVTELDTVDTITATLTLADPDAGSLSDSSGNGESYDEITGVWSVTAPVENVNAALAEVVFDPGLHYDLDTGIATRIRDAAGTGPADGLFTLQVTPVNDIPTATQRNQAKTYNEGETSIDLTNIITWDVDTGDTVTAILTLADTSTGALTAAGGNGETYDAGAGEWSVSGSSIDVNAALASVAFEPVPDNDVNTVVTVHVEDIEGTGPADGVISLTVVPSNDVPTATNMTHTKTYTEGDSSVALDDIVITEVDIGDTIYAALVLADPAAGSLTVSSGNGETYDGETGAWEITGTVAAANAALAEIAFIPVQPSSVLTRRMVSGNTPWTAVPPGSGSTVRAAPTR